MTDEQKQIEIVQACGWKLLPSGFWLSPYSTEEHPNGLLFDGPPDVLNDLNAMQEVVKTLNPGQRSDYFRMLEEVVDQAAGRVVAFAVGDATARQRAEAFLRTIGKWVED
jgi:hypothetical protein